MSLGSRPLATCYVLLPVPLLLIVGEEGETDCQGAAVACGMPGGGWAVSPQGFSSRAKAPSVARIGTVDGTRPW